MTREQAITLWQEYNTEDSLYRHALAVEAIMKYYAQKYHEDIEKWALVGLLHDLDYEKYPDQHCYKTKEILEQKNIEPEIIRAILSHGYGICTDVAPESLMEKILYTIDELSGFITACALIRPSKSLDDLELKSIKKKWKTAQFASGVDRDIIQKGADMLEQDLDSIIQECILALCPIAEQLGLQKLSS
ncbi:MAG: HD domain-containing protein [Brevinema sp.]